MIKTLMQQDGLQPPTMRVMESAVVPWLSNPDIVARLTECAKDSRRYIDIPLGRGQLAPGDEVLSLLDESTTLAVFAEHCSGIGYPTVDIFVGDDASREATEGLILVLVQAAYRANLISSAAIHHWRNSLTSGAHEKALSQLASLFGSLWRYGLEDMANEV
jgi:hypothetical protein